VLAHVLDQHRHGDEVVERRVEEPLDLAAVEVDRHQPGRPGHGEHVGDQLGGDRLAALGLAVLAAVAVVGHHGRDALGRPPLGRVDHRQMLDDRVVDRHGPVGAVALDDEHVHAPHRLAEPAVDLAVGEVVEVGLAQRHAEAAGDLLGQREVRPPRQEVQLLLGDELHRPTFSRSRRASA
jgi:hypothetical protein